MSFFTAELIGPMLAQNGKGGWMQLLILFAVMAVYAVAGILRARAGKSEQEEVRKEGEAGSARSARKSLAKLFEEQLLKESGGASRPVQRERRPARIPERPKQMPSRAVAPAVRAAAASHTTDFRRLEGLADHKMTGVSSVEESVGRVSKALDALQAEHPSVGSTEPAVRDLGLGALSYGDEGELTRAILYYEILGRPLSLRDPGEHILGL